MMRVTAGLVLLVCAVTGVAAGPADSESDSFKPGAALDGVCGVLRNGAEAEVRHLDAAAIDSVAGEISDLNMALVERIEEAYQGGRYGEPGSAVACEDALAAFIYGAMTAFDFVVSLASQERVIYATSEADLEEAFTKRLRNPGFYPVIRLKSGLMGFGGFCLEFAVEEDGKREIVTGGEKTSAWAEDIEIEGHEVRVLNVDMKTFSHDRLHIVYEEISGGKYRTIETEIDGTPIEIVLIEDVEGMYIRKWGFHKSHGVAIWKSVSRGLDPPPRGQRYLGAAAYFPALQFELPWFLPDIGLHDLRMFDYPEPLLTVDAVRELQERGLEWVRIQGNLRFSDWEGQGTIPDLIHERFPDY